MQPTDRPAHAIEQRVLEVVLRVAGPSRSPEGATPATPLGEGGFLLDSVALLEVVVACESAFGIELDADQDLTLEGLRSARSLAERIQRHVGR
jgi:acyl carrier protein